MASFQAKMGRDKMRMRKKNSGSEPFQPDPEQGIPTKLQKTKIIKKHHYDFISMKTGQDRLKVIQKKKLSLRSVPTRPGKGNSKTIAKKCKKLRNIIMISFHAKTGRDRLRVIPKKKKIIIPIHSNPTRNRDFQKNSKRMQKIKKHHSGFITGRDRLRVTPKKKRISVRSIPTRFGIKNSQKIAKKCKNLKTTLWLYFKPKQCGTC